MILEGMRPKDDRLIGEGASEPCQQILEVRKEGEPMVCGRDLVVLGIRAILLEVDEVGPGEVGDAVVDGS
jgi:hypothetical protein